MIENPGDALAKGFGYADSSTGSNVTYTWTTNLPNNGTFDDAAHEIAREVANIVIRKQWDYGQENILGAPFGPETGIVVRLWDKISRLKNLLESENEPNNESIEDTYIDIIGYALLALMVQRDQFTLPLKLEK